MNPPAAAPATGPKIGPSEVVYQNAYQQVCRVRLEFPDFFKDIYVNEHGIRAGVLFLRDDHVLLVRQYRYLTRDLAWEIPGGKIETDEAPEAGAARESLEETGLRCHHLQPLIYFLPGLDTCDNPTHVFLCTEFEVSNSADACHVDPHEISGRVWVPFQRCLHMIFERKIVDVMTITALLACHAKRTPAS